MHASNFAPSGRRRANLKQQDNHLVKSQDLTELLNNEENSASSHNKNLMQFSNMEDSKPLMEQSPQTNVKNLTNTNTDFYNISYASDSMQDSLSSDRSAVLQDKSTSLNPVPLAHDALARSIFDQNDAALYNSFERERRRSGSWTGVNESDDELEKIAKPVPVQMSLDNTGQSSSSSTRFNQYGSLENFNSTNSTVPEEVASQNITSSCDTCSIGSSSVTRENIGVIEEKIRRRLKFFFMNPVEKWEAKRRFPWKLVVQIIKIVIVTAQLCTFATQRYNHVSYLWDTKVSFSHMFIKGWDTSREVTAYPPSTGPLAVYGIAAFYEFLDFTITTFAKVNESAIGTYNYKKENETLVMPIFCINQYSNAIIDIDNLTYELSNNIDHRCVSMPTSVFNDSIPWSTKAFLKANNVTIHFDALSDASFSFQLRTIKLKGGVPPEPPECYNLETTIFFDNNDHDGQMLVDLDIGAMVLDCKGSVNSVLDENYLSTFRSSLNILTIIICSISFVMCLRSLYRAISLRRTTDKFFRLRFTRSLTNWEKFDFVNLWYVLIIVNDTLIVLGSIIKMSLEAEDYDGYLDKWNVCSLLLGTGNLLVWFGCLRYLGFFKTYNVLILTIKKCVPNVLRYSICISMVFGGYSFCGWLVLGPYHLKFRSLSSTIECLYSLVNGDDMYATFSSTVGKDWIVWWFSRIYLYTFISLFIYIILSLFIAIIMDSYETIKSYYENGYPKSDLARFAEECRADPYSGDYLESERTIQDIINYLCCCHLIRPHQTPPTPGYEALPT